MKINLDDPQTFKSILIASVVVIFVLIVLTAIYFQPKAVHESEKYKIVYNPSNSVYEVQYKPDTTIESKDIDEIEMRLKEITGEENIYNQNNINFDVPGVFLNDRQEILDRLEETQEDALRGLEQTYKEDINVGFPGDSHDHGVDTDPNESTLELPKEVF